MSLFVGEGNLGQWLRNTQSLAAEVQRGQRHQVIQSWNDIRFQWTWAGSGAVVSKIPLVGLNGSKTQVGIKLYRHALSIGR